MADSRRPSTDSSSDQRLNQPSRKPTAPQPISPHLDQTRPPLVRQEGSVGRGLHRFDAGACDVMMLYYLVDRPEACEQLRTYGRAEMAAAESEGGTEGGGGRGGIGRGSEKQGGSAFDSIQMALSLAFQALTTLCPEHGSVLERQHKKAQFIRDHQDGSPAKRKGKGRGVRAGKRKGASPEKQVKEMERDILVRDCMRGGSTFREPPSAPCDSLCCPRRRLLPPRRRLL